MKSKFYASPSSLLFNLYRFSLVIYVIQFNPSSVLVQCFCIRKGFSPSAEISLLFERSNTTVLKSVLDERSFF